MNLVLGTAEFNPEGYGGKPCPETKEIVRILNLAWEAGIQTLDTSPSYGCDELLDKYAFNFNRILKDRPTEPSTNPNIFYHYKPDEEPVNWAINASVYDFRQLSPYGHNIVPFNLYNTEFAGYFTPNDYIRSVFERGRLLEVGWTVKDCLQFVKRHRSQGVIVGVNSVNELEEILKAWGS